MFMLNDVISTVSPTYSLNSYLSCLLGLKSIFPEKRKTKFY